MVNLGDRVVIKESKYLSDIANAERVGKTGVVTDISIPVGVQLSYKVALDEPINNRGYITRYVYVNHSEHDKCLEVLQ